MTESQVGETGLLKAVEVGIDGCVLQGIGLAIIEELREGLKFHDEQVGAANIYVKLLVHANSESRISAAYMRQKRHAECGFLTTPEAVPACCMQLPCMCSIRVLYCALSQRFTAFEFNFCAFCVMHAECSLKRKSQESQSYYLQNLKYFWHFLPFLRCFRERITDYFANIRC